MHSLIGFLESPVPLVSADMLDTLYTWYLSSGDEAEISKKILSTATTLSILCDRIKMYSSLDSTNKRSVQFILPVISSHYESHAKSNPQNVPFTIDLQYLSTGIFNCINNNSSSVLLAEYLHCLYCLEKSFQSDCLVQMDLLLPLADHIVNEDNEYVLGYFFTILNIIKHSFEEEILQLLQFPNMLEKLFFLQQITTNTIFALSCQNLQEFCIQ